MRKLALIPLLALLATCTDDGTVTPVAPDGPEFAKCSAPPCGKGGGGGGDADGEYTVTDLGTLFGGKASSSGARDISNLDAGQLGQVVVGASRDAAGNTVATLWTVTGTDVTDPQALSGFTTSDARAINKSGTVVVGSAGDSYGLIPVRWTPSSSGWQATTLSLGGFDTGVARDVNDAGIIVGWSQRESAESSETRAILWRSDDPPVELRELPPLGDIAYARADAINDAASGGGGLVVAGQSGIWIGDHLLFHAVLWKLNGATVEGPCDLHTWQPAYRNPPQGGDVLHSHAWGISDATIDGSVQVVGSRTIFVGEVRATVWTVDVGGTEWWEPGVLCAMVNDNEPRDLGSVAYALDINNDGMTVGEDHSLSNVRPVLWTTDGQVVLPSLKGDYGTAQGINDAGQIVGWTRAGRQRNHAVLWTKRN